MNAEQMFKKLEEKAALKYESMDSNEERRLIKTLKLLMVK